MHQTTKPATFDKIALRCAPDIRGGKKPCVVEFASNTADALAADDAPTITFPLLVIAPVVKLAIVPTLIKLDKVVKVVLVVAVMFPAVVAVVAVVALPFNVPIKLGAVIAPLVITEVTELFPNCTVFDVFTIAPFPIAVAFVKEALATFAAFPMAVL